MAHLGSAYVVKEHRWRLSNNIKRIVTEIRVYNFINLDWLNQSKLVTKQAEPV